MTKAYRFIRQSFMLMAISGTATFASAQTGIFNGVGNCDEWLNWTSNVRGNRGVMPTTRNTGGQRSNVWFCQAKGLNQAEDKYYDYGFYDLSSGVAYDHAQYRCEREQQKCEVRCAFVPYLCIPYTLQSP